jgi:CubicO group peptidase (beta-lactamase class C family)
MRVNLIIVRGPLQEDEVKIVTAVALLLGAMGLPLYAADGQAAAEAKAPVAIARTGFTPSQAREFRERYSYEEVISAGDVSLFHFLNLDIWLPTAMVSRQGKVVDLATAIDPKVGQTRVTNAAGGVNLSDYLRSAASRAQGMVVVHRGRIVFEDYPGMRPSDFHVWMSVAKTTTSLVVRLLAEEGKVDVEKPIDSYMPALRNTEWAGIRVIDVLDMASGMDIIENQAGRENPRSVITRYNLAASGEKNADGEKENLFELIRSAKRSGPAGKAFEYSSINTTLLALLAETVENKRWNDIYQERVWSKMTVEGDLQVSIAPDSTPLPHGLVASRLRDLARYGMLYTPSWNKAARERIVSQAYVRQIQEGGRKEIFLRGEIGNHLTTAFFPASPPSANHWQWDAVWPDGDFYKGGVWGQGLYVSPARDLVIAWFSTAMSNDLTQYARQIAMNTPALR